MKPQPTPQRFDGRFITLTPLDVAADVAELFARVEQVGSDRVINPLVMYDSYTVSGPAMLVKSLKISG